MKLTEPERQEIEEYLSLDEDLLYSLIPPFVSTDAYSPVGQVEDGKREFERIKPSLYEAVCVNWNCCSKIDDPALQDNINLVVALADTIASPTIGIPPFIIATILVKIGLRRFCKCN